MDNIVTVKETTPSFKSPYGLYKASNSKSYYIHFTTYGDSEKNDCVWIENGKLGNGFQKRIRDQRNKDTQVEGTVTMEFTRG